MIHQVSREALEKLFKATMFGVKYAFHIQQVMYFFNASGSITPFLMTSEERALAYCLMPNPKQAYEVV